MSVNGNRPLRALFHAAIYRPEGALPPNWSNLTRADFAIRPPPHARRPEDQTPEKLRPYLDGLEARVLGHLWKHAQRWHGQEINRTLRRWDRPELNHPRPSWAPKPNRQLEAQQRAERVLSDRLIRRLDTISALRRAHGVPENSMIQMFAESYRSILAKKRDGPHM